jgi:EpsI family protein
LHDFAGIVLFVSALLIIMGVDSLIQRWVGKPVRTEVKENAVNTALPEQRIVLSVVLAGCFVASYLLASYLQPRVSHAGVVPQFEKLLPERFAQWQSVPALVPQVDLSTNNEAGTDYDKPYDAVLMRSYKDQSGHVVMLAIAYAMQQTQEIKIHRPEYCYHAQGFTVVRQIPVTLAAGSQKLAGNGLLVRRSGRNEWVQYWIRIGSGFPVQVWMPGCNY